MPSVTGRAPLQVDGVVHGLDTVNRELTALVGGTLISFDVPPDCVVVLRGERVKLRLVQPGDRVRIAFAEIRSCRRARRVEVQTGHPSSDPARRPTAPG